MPILTTPKYKSKLCIPDMLNFTVEALSAVPDFTIEHEEHGMVVWDDPIDVRSLNIDKIVSFTCLNITTQITQKSQNSDVNSINQLPSHFITVDQRSRLKNTFRSMRIPSG